MIMTWGKAGRGRFYKRAASKADRRLAKLVIRQGDVALHHATARAAIRLSSECKRKAS
jgi:hypothetical protein